MNDILNEFYRKPAYFELLDDCQKALEIIPLEIEKAQIEYFKAQFILDISKDKNFIQEAEGIKKENIEKIKELKVQELQLKEVMSKAKRKYDALYNDLTLSSNEQKVNTTIISKINNILKR